MSEQPAAGPASPSEKPLPLPPVQPPTAGFLVQLFLAPLLIVMIIVVVWLMFSWLAQMGSNPQDLARDIARMNDASWQRAYNLAELLRMPKYDYLKDDHQLANELGQTLTTLRNSRPDRKRDAAKETDAERKQNKDAVYENRIKLEMFLCRVLGEFRVDDGLPALVAAAEPDDSSDPQGFVVRSAAVQAIALQAKQVPPQKLQENEKLMAALIETSKERGEGEFAREEYDKLRSAAAFALGLVGGEEAITRLTQMLDDGDANTRFNAATALARQGDIGALPVLEEMLDADSTAGLDDPDATLPEHVASGVEFKRGMIIGNGIRAAKLLHDKNPTADYKSLIACLDKLQANAKVNDKMKLDAKELKLMLTK
ncbi:MAG TPA: HEAT repeat domain-containing protein [Pirellulaceae bacterium]|nr:HEAT repeat domain-containing protein [Pirellulaceae bacterium]